MTCADCGGPQSVRVTHVRRAVTAGLFVLALVLVFTLTGDLLHDLAEGLQRSLLPLWKVFVPALVLLSSVVAAFVRVKRPVCDRCGSTGSPWLEAYSREKSQQILSAGPGRRYVLRALGAGGATVAAAGAGVATAVTRNKGWLPVANDFFITNVENIAPQARPEWKESRIKGYRRLGRTNAMVSDISLGAGRINNVEVARLALERGVTYFDTSPDYSDSASERILGEAMKGHRDKLFLATKFCRPDGHLLNETPVPEIMTAVEESLQRLQTDHVDLIHIHSCDRVDRLMAPNIHEAFDKLKQQGKVRFLGVSTHTPNLEEVANAAIDSGRFDVMMLAYHFGMWPTFSHILDKAKQHDVAVVAMKTLKGAKHTNLADFRQEAGAYSQSAFRWVLSNPAVACLVVSFYELGQIDEYLYASGTAVRDSDVAMLERYDQLTAGDYCQPHCGICLDSCPEQLAINDVLRHRMYFKDYGWEKEAMRLYAKLERNASRCVDCAAPCTGTCPIGVPIREKMLDAHYNLTFRS